jgi:Cadherin-like beta sandwich domain
VRSGVALVLVAGSVLAQIPSTSNNTASAAVVESYVSFGSQTYTPDPSATTNCRPDQGGSYPIATNSVISKILPAGSGTFYIGGCFLNWAGIDTADYVAYWNGSAWTGVTSSSASNGELNAMVNDLIIYNGDLYAGGAFTDAGGDSNADYFAKFNISAAAASRVWSGMSPGFNETPFEAGSYVHVLKEHPSNGSLIVAGLFTSGVQDGLGNGSTGGMPAFISGTQNIALWNGSNWSALSATSPYPNYSASSSFPIRAITTVGSDIYVGGFRPNGWISSLKAFTFMRFDATSSTWVANLAASFVANPSAEGSQGYGVMALANLNGKVILGGSLSHSSAGSKLLQYDPGSNSFSSFENVTVGYVQQGSGIRTINAWGNQVFVSGAFSGGTNGNGSGILRWDGTQWSTFSKYEPLLSSALAIDENFSGTTDRLLIASNSNDMGGLSSADKLVGITLADTNTLDTLTSTNSSPALAFSPGTNSYSISIPNASTSETFNFAPSQSAAAVFSTIPSGGFDYTTVESDGTATVSVNEGQTVTVLFKVVPTSGAASRTYSVSVTRAAAASSSSSSPSSSSSSSSSVAPSSSSTTEAPPAPTTPTTAAPAGTNTGATSTVSNVVKHGATASKTTLLKLAKATVPSGGKYSLKIASTYAKVCKVSGTGVKTLKAGTCKVSITITPKAGRASTKTVTLKVT